MQISDLFLEKGTIVSTMGRNQKEKEVMYAKKAGTLPNFPVIVVVDEYSASASEILAGALQDNKRALIMGHRTFGKGSVQSVVKLGDGSGLKLTVGRYYTPSGKSIQSYGIVPDIELEDLDATVLEQARVKREIHREKDMHGHLIGDSEDDEESVGPAASKDSKATKTAAQKEAAKDANKKKVPVKKIQYWWTESDSKGGDKEFTPRDKLLKDDFQMQQAYNYLKAWYVIEDQKNNPVPETKTK